MIPFLGAPIGKGLLIGIAILLGILAIESGVVLSQATAIGKLQAEAKAGGQLLKQTETERAACVTAHQLLQTAHQGAMDEIRRGKEEADQARQTIDDLTATIQREANNVHRERDIIFRLPGCRELADLDIAAACPDLARSMRGRAAAQVPATGEDRGASAGAAGSAPDR